ncbi:MAG: acetyl-CoA carboxylase biotin carboxyl carrier protein [Myxococcales bacterium]|nr:acetyl-CoA carboxylase biotin carboxyl carrier protein [Myxococcales bacterium]
MDIDLQQLRDLMQALRDFELDELELEKGDERIVLRRAAAGAPVLAAPAGGYHLGGASVPPPPPPVAAEAAPAAADEGTFITSPFVGTFYRAPNPGAEAFAKVGGHFRAGQTLCIVEAMKLMNEIEAEFDGEILEILVENGKPVEFGERLFKVRKA